MTCDLYGFPCEKDFLTSLQIPPESLATRWDFVTYFTLQGALIIINTLFKVVHHENHVRWMYLTTVINMGERRKYARYTV